MATVVDICNIALTHIGQRPIQSLDEGTQAAQKCSVFFNMQRDAVLRAASWNFATRIEPLALIPDANIPGWDYLYAYPADCLFLRKVAQQFSDTAARVHETGIVERPAPYRVVLVPNVLQKAIACNLSNAFSEYTEQIEDTTMFDPLFVEALSYKLASALSQTLTGDIQLGARMLQVYGVLIDEAKRTNGSEGLTIYHGSSSFVDAR